MHLAVPRAALGLAWGKAVTLDSKWVDNLQKPGDVMAGEDTVTSAPSALSGFTFAFLRASAPLR